MKLVHLPRDLLAMLLIHVDLKERERQRGVFGLTSEESLRTWGDFPGGPVAKTLHSQCRGLGSVPGQGTRSHMPQLRIHTLQQKILCAITKTEVSTSHN